MKGFGEYDATGLAELVRKKEVSPAELLEAAVESAEAAQTPLNCFSQIFADRARSALDSAPGEGPFAGVPFAVKDLGLRMEGLTLTSGSRAFKGNVATVDSTLVQRYKAAGFTLFAQTTSPE
uniref:amidase family protein n=1 Tax=Henriciella aquimarina TaxID=545261 RepID=UPI0022773D1F